MAGGLFVFVRTAPPGGCALAITAGQYRPSMAHCPLSKRSGGPFLFISLGSIAERDSVFASLPPKGGHAHVSAEALSGQRSPHGRSVPAAHGSLPPEEHLGGPFLFCTACAISRCHAGPYVIPDLFRDGIGLHISLLTYLISFLCCLCFFVRAPVVLKPRRYADLQYLHLEYSNLAH